MDINNNKDVTPTVASQNGPSWKRPQSKTAPLSVKTAPSEKQIFETDFIVKSRCES